MKLHLLIITFVLLAGFSCNDTEMSKSEMLTRRPWFLTSVVENDINVTTAELEDCEIDDLFNFKKDGSMLLDVGPQVCYSGELDKSGVWSWRDGKSTIVLQFEDDDAAVAWEILELSTTTLKLKTYFEDEATTAIITLEAILEE